MSPILMLRLERASTLGLSDLSADIPELRKVFMEGSALQSESTPRFSLIIKVIASFTLRRFSLTFDRKRLPEDSVLLNLPVPPSFILDD